MLELSREFSSLAEQIAGTGGGAAPAHRVVDLAVKSVEGCRWATITTLRGKHSQLLAASDKAAEQLERAQNELGEGPTADVARLDENLAVTDLERDTRWPRFAPFAVRAAGVTSVRAYRLAGSHPTVLTLWGAGPGDESGAAADHFAGQASTLVALIAATEQAANLQTALQSSREIGMALGILMAHRKITSDDAFDLLRTASQNLHRKLRDVALEVMDTGTLPDGPRRPQD